MSIAGLHCEVWQPQGLYEAPSSSSSSSISVQPPEFYIDFFVSSYAANQREQITRSIGYKNFRQRCTQDYSFSWSAISWMLSQTNVPYHLQPFFIQHISVMARRIASQPNNALSSTIPIVVDLMLPMDEEEEEEDASSGPHFGNGYDRASIEDILERVDEIDDDDRGHICVICLDEISISISEFDDAYEPVRMPCFHVFHRNCIRKWLQLTNPCPLCRFHP